jgi:hypothetical protein
MSIHDEIKFREDEGRLFRVKPQIPGTPEPRIIYVTTDVKLEIFGDTDDTPQNPRMGRLHADLDRFIAGAEIAVGGRRHKSAYIKQLEPERDGVWEIRSVDPDPQFRLFGRFADTDVFVATHLMQRSWLGVFQSFSWRQSIRRSKAIWGALFVSWPAKDGDHIHDYISENVLDLRSSER